MAKELYYGEDSRRSLLAGVDKLANTVKKGAPKVLTPLG